MAEYREEQEPAPGAEELPWMRKEVPLGEIQPKLTVEGLQPNTLYEVRMVDGNATSYCVLNLPRFTFIMTSVSSRL